MSESNKDEFWNKIDQILEMYEYNKYVSGHVPSDISPRHMSILIQMKDDREWSKYFRYLFITEVRKLKDCLKKANKKLKHQQLRASHTQPITFGVFDENNNLNYNLWGNSLVSRISPSSLSHIQYEAKLRFAELFGQKLLIDVDYDEHMTLSESRIQIRHILHSFNENLTSALEPFNIYLTNCDYSKPTMSGLMQYSNSSPFQVSLILLKP